MHVQFTALNLRRISGKVITFLLCCFLLFAGCQKKNDNGKGLEVRYTNFSNTIGLQDNLNFLFNRDVIISDSLIGRWLDEQYLKIEPPVEGRFQWTDADELLFSPVNGFKPATDYTVILQPELLKLNEENSSWKGETTFKATTPDLTMFTAYASWILSESNQPEVVIAVTYSIPVPAEVVRDNMSFTIDGTAAEHSLISEGIADRHTFRLQPAPAGNKQAAIDLSLSQVDQWNRGSDDESTVLSDRSELRINKVVAEASGVSTYIKVYTSQEIAPDVIRRHLEIDPKVTYEIEPADYGFHITSAEFSSNREYNLLIKKKITGVLGGVLKKEYRQIIGFGELSPEISFIEEKAMYLDKAGEANLEIRMVQLDEVKVSVYKIFENNISQFINRGKRWGSYYNYTEEGYYDYYDYRFYEISDAGQLIYEMDYKVSALAEGPNGKLLHLDFMDELPDFKGIYVVQVQDKEKYYISDSKLLSFSDIGLIAKQDPKDLYVFCNSILTTDAVSGAQVRLISSHNQQMATGQTTADGIVRFSRSEFPEDFEPGMVVASKGDDYNYMLLSRNQVATARYDVGGKSTKATAYDCFLYAERDIYRPGETIHVAGILRDFDWQLAGKMPVDVIFKSPEGRKLKTSRQNLDAQGMFSAELVTVPESSTGSYSVEVYSGSGQYLKQKTIQVEEFMPDRIKVTLDLDNESYSTGEQTIATLTATNYFGPPAANRNYEAELTVNQDRFTADGYEDYHFQPNTSFSFVSIFRDGVTDQDGQAELTYDLDKAWKEHGLLRARLYATVFDETGRPVNQVEEFPIHTQEVFPGIALNDRWVATKKPQEFRLVALNSQGEPQNYTVDVEVVRYEWNTVLRRDGNRYRYSSEREEVSIQRESVDLSGAYTSYYFNPIQSGSYELRISIPGAPVYVVQSFYAWGYDDNHSSTFEVDREGRINISMDKEEYTIGDKAMATLTLPFTGKVLLTTEREGIMSYSYINATERTVRYPITIEESHLPNIYVSATLIKPHKPGGVPLTVAHGFTPVTVRPVDGKLPVTITAVDQSRSKTKQNIKVKTAPNASLTIAVVDEGILALKNQKTSDPFTYFYGKRALEVATYAMYKYLFPEVTATGGGADFAAELAKMVNPMKNERVKLVSFWSDVVQANGRGLAELEIDIPPFSGKLRVMAVAAREHQFGSADHQITVADPVVLSPSIPRFLSVGDAFDMKVNISNTTDEPIQGNLEIESNDALDVLDFSTTAITIPAQSESSATAVVLAGNMADTASLTVRFRTSSESFSARTGITVRLPASLVRTAESGLLEDTDEFSTVLTSDFVEGTALYKLFVSNSPLARFSDHLQDLIQYPFGCLEQTISKAFPQLYFEELVKAIDENTDTEADQNAIKKNVQQAVSKISRLQMSNGGLAYWPNAGNANWWSSAYAAHFLLEAREQGFEVDRNLIDRLLDYLSFRLQKKEKTVYYYNGDQRKDIIMREATYSLYVLALAGKADKGNMRYMLNHPEELSIDAKYLLACTFTLTNDVESARQLLPAAFEGERSVPTFGGSFNSYLRDLALATNALIEANPDHEQLPNMVRMLSEGMASAEYLNTQEKSFGFLALGKFARLNPVGKASATITSNGKKVGQFKGEDLWIEAESLEGDVSIKSKGEGVLYYTLFKEGLPQNGKVVEKDNLLQVRRNYYDRNKQLLNGKPFKQNDLIVVELKVKSLSGKSIENVAVTDILPAGFEIENARITEMPELSWVDLEQTFDHRDIRDDRIHIFTTVTGYEQRFYYLVRAVTPGTYQQGPASAVSMYRGEYHSYHGSGTIRVDP